MNRKNKALGAQIVLKNTSIGLKRPNPPGREQSVGRTLPHPNYTNQRLHHAHGKIRLCH